MFTFRYTDRTLYGAIPNTSNADFTSLTDIAGTSASGVAIMPLYLSTGLPTVASPLRDVPLNIVPNAASQSHLGLKTGGPHWGIKLPKLHFDRHLQARTPHPQRHQPSKGGILRRHLHPRMFNHLNRQFLG